MVSGRVQGVFFRATCAREARALQVVGWIRNLSGGRVEALFEGSDEAVEAMVDWCRHGPDLARVDDVIVTSELPVGERGFVITG